MAFLEERRFHVIRKKHLNLEWEDKHIVAGTIKCQGFTNRVISSDKDSGLIICSAGEHVGQINIFVDKTEIWEVAHEKRSKLLALTTEIVPQSIHYPQSMYELRQVMGEFLDESIDVNKEHIKNIYNIM